jgi:hypothetical protein
MHIDFRTIEDSESYVTVPEGTYLCRVAEVRENLAMNGSPRWSLRLEVCEGDFTGRTAGWDGLTFSERGLPRVKRVLGRLGFDVSGALDLQSSDLVGLRALVQFVTEEREDPLTGRRTVRLRVPYSGYAMAEDGSGNGVT